MTYNQATFTNNFKNNSKSYVKYFVSLVAIITIAVLAMVLCLARVKSGSLLLPILLHIINNGLAMGQYVLMFEG